MDIVTDDQLEMTRKGHMMDTNSYVDQSSMGRSKNSQTLMGRTNKSSRSPLKDNRDSRDKTKKTIQESVNRLSSPKKSNANFHENDEDLVFSIKMSKEEYGQYKKTRETLKGSASGRKTSPMRR